MSRRRPRPVAVARYGAGMRLASLAHLSDLHLGRSAADARSAAEVVRALEPTGAHVVVTGDVTHRGRLEELALFHHLFRPLLRSGRVTVVPGNHDRGGDDAASAFMRQRVEIEHRPGLYLVKIDSTAPHNRSLIRSHGDICARVLDAVDDALERAPPGALVAVLLHHHPLPLPEESLAERVSSLFGWPFAQELAMGHELVARALGRCDLLLHGHRHVPGLRVLGQDRPLVVCNAGSTTERLAWPVHHHRRGKLLGSTVAALRPALAQDAAQ